MARQVCLCREGTQGVLGEEKRRFAVVWSCGVEAWMRISRQELQEIRELPDASEVDHLRELDLSNKVGGRAQSRVILTDGVAC